MTTLRPMAHGPEITATDRRQIISGAGFSFRNFIMSFFGNSKMYSKDCDYAGNNSCADFSVWRPDMDTARTHRGAYSTPLDPLAGLRGRIVTRKVGMGKDRR